MRDLHISRSFVAFTLFSTILVAINNANASEHQQVHIALGTDETEMVITWATIESIDDHGVVNFGTSSDNLTDSATAITTYFEDDDAYWYNYRALLTGLKPSTTYYYRVGSKASSWSKVFQFKTLNSGNKWLPSFAIYGDLGIENERSLPYLTKDVEKGMYDVIFHIGDMAYDLYEDDGEQGNDFMRSIEKVAARVPYMTCPGNHEQYANFSFYDTRFSMISDRTNPERNKPITERLNNHFHSMDIGPAHIVMFSTEYYYYTKYGWDQIVRQYQWLENDLKRAHANRAERPWIIVMGHRPLYCLKMGDSSCDHEALDRPTIRKGIHMDGHRHSYGLEDLFYKYGVDIQFYGHEHFYGRLLPIYNYTVMGGSKERPYDDPHGPIHIITGSAGNREDHPPFNPHLKKWVADHHYDYGYTRMVFRDTHHITLEQTSDDKEGIVTDKIDIIKRNNHPKWLRV